MALISQTDLEQKLGRTLTTDEASVFSLINYANQSYIERMIGSKLETTTEATRYYDGGVQYLKIDPCSSISKVEFVDVDNGVVETIDDDYYTTEPVNYTIKTMIRYRYGKFYSGINNIAVTALFSIAADAEIVAIIKNALLNALVSEIDSSGSIVKESIEGYSVELAQTATKDSLDSIKYLFPEVF